MSDAKDGPGIKVNVRQFWARFKQLVDNWKAGGRMWKNDCDVLVLPIGAPEEEAGYRRLAAMQIFLFGYELSHTVIVINGDTMHMLTSASKKKLFSVLGEQDETTGLRLNIIERTKADKDAKNISNMVRVIEKAGNRIGMLTKETAKGAFIKRFSAAVSAAGCDVVDVALGFASALVVKDDNSQDLVRKAGEFAAAALRKSLLPEVENAIDEGVPVTHMSLAEKTEEVFEDPKKIKKKHFDPMLLEVCYTPIVMSGGRYDLRPSAISNDEKLHDGTIICEVGARFDNYCANIGRTYFIGPTPYQGEVYKVLLDVYQACKSAMLPGKKINGIYQAALQAIADSKHPELKDYFSKDCGCAIGVEFREAAYTLSPKNTKLIQVGMVFNLCIGFQKLHIDGTILDPTETKTSLKHFAVLLADTFVVAEDMAVVVTSAPRKYSEVSYDVRDENEMSDDESEDESDDDDSKKQRGVQKESLRGETGGIDEELRHQQQLLAKRKHAEMLAKLKAKTGEGFDRKTDKSDIKFASYSSPNRYPQARSDRIYVDSAAESVLFPIGGLLTPFHIACIKNVHKQETGGYVYLSVQFNIPHGANERDVAAFADKKKTFVREICYKSKSQSIETAYFQIKELLKLYRDRKKEFEEKADLVEQPNLIVDRNLAKVIRLSGVSMRPNVRKKMVGTLEAHRNGFRFITNNRDKVDIIYKNIKHAFFQPCDKKTIQVLLHFHLKHPIMLKIGRTGKKPKKTNYVQFYVEIVEASQDLADHRRFRDADSILEEQDERRQRNKYNEKFRKFSKNVEDHLRGDSKQPTIEFDVPYTKYAFDGVPQKTTIPLLPTVRSLIALDDNPPFVVTLSEVEIASFERVRFDTGSFDLAFVWKDYEREPVRIDAIPIKTIDKIKQWLTTTEVLFFENSINLLWKQIMAFVREDPEKFIRKGGWPTFLREQKSHLEGDDDGSDGEGFESESEFEPSSSGDDGYDDDDDYSEMDESEEEDEDWEEEDEDVSWEALEQKAKQADKRKAQQEAFDDRNERSSKKRRRR